MLACALLGALAPVAAQDVVGDAVALDGVHLQVGSSWRTLAPGAPLHGRGTELAVGAAEGRARLSSVQSGDGIGRWRWAAESFAEVRLAASPLVGRAVRAAVAPDRLWLRLAAPAGGGAVGCRLRVQLLGEQSGEGSSVRISIDLDADGQPDLAVGSVGGSAQLDLPLHLDAGGRDVLVELGSVATAVARADRSVLARASATASLELLPAVLSADAGTGCGDPAWSLSAPARLAGLYELQVDGGAGPTEAVWLVLGVSRGALRAGGAGCWLWATPDTVVGWIPAADGSLRLAAGPQAPPGTRLYAQAVGLSASGAVRTTNALRLSTW